MAHTRRRELGISTVSQPNLDTSLIIESVQFTLWYPEIKKFSTAPSTIEKLRASLDSSPVARRICDVYDQTKAPFPGYGNMKPTLELCDMFLDGQVDPHRLSEVKARARRDGNQINIYTDAFMPHNKGEDNAEGIILPIELRVFGTPIYLIEFMGSRLNEDGLVGINPDWLNHIKHCIT